MTDVSIWMPIIWSDYDKDTSRLSLEQHGIYLMLIKEYWNNGGPIENDIMGIYRSLGALTDSEQKNILYILDKYFKLENGYYHHSRIEAELTKALENKKSKSDAGKKGMASRYNKTITSDITELQRSNNPSPSPSPVTKVTKSIPKPLLDFKSHFDSFKEITGKGYSTINDARKRKLEILYEKKLIASLDDWVLEIGKIPKSQFLMVDWVTWGIDWILEERNFLKLKEGNYETASRNNQNTSRNGDGKPSLSEQLGREIAAVGAKYAVSDKL